VKTRTRRLLLPLGMALLFVVFFDSVAAYPFRLFVVFLHEIGHGVAAVLTGGRVVSIGLSANEGGVCVTQGGVPFVAIGVFTIVAALLYVRTWFGFAYTLTTGFVLLLIAVRLRPPASEWLLAAIGSMSMLYALADIASDVILRHSGMSDAAALARLTHVPAVAWGVLWIGLSLAVLFSVVRRLA
jgi:hypothetical protein